MYLPFQESLKIFTLEFSFPSYQSLSRVQLWDSHELEYTDPSILHYLLEFVQIHVHWVGDAIYLILCCPLLLLPSTFPIIRVFSNESALCIRWPDHWSFSFNNSPFSEYSGLILFRIDWFEFPAVQGTLRSPLEHHNLKASIVCGLAFFMVQLSHLYMTTEKTIALTMWTFVGKVISLLFTMLSRFVIVFLPRSKHLLISPYF